MTSDQARDGVAPQTMTKVDAVKAIEAKFDAMTGEQRTTLWRTIHELAEAEYSRGYRNGQATGATP